MQTAMMSSNAGVKPQQAFVGNVKSLQAPRRTLRVNAASKTVMSSAALEEVPTPEKRVSSLERAPSILVKGSTGRFCCS